jgi:putative peptidoglycan lipid II flippase
MIAGAFLLSSTTIVDQSMAAMLGSGNVAALNYGYKIVAFALGIGSLAIGTAVLPHFSQMVAAEDWNAVRHTLKTYTRLILMVTVPFTLAFVLSSRLIVSVLYERGNFTAADTLVVSRVQAFYALQIPFYVLGILVVRLISSLRANHVLMWGAILSLALDVALNLLLMPHLGVAGIGLSNSVVYLVSLCYLLAMLSRQMRSVAHKHG